MTQFSSHQTADSIIDDCGHFFVDAFSLGGSLPDYYKSFIEVFSAINALLAIPTVFGNALVILLIWSTSSLHHCPGNVLISLLSCSDFFIGVLVQPSFAAAQVALLRKQIKKHCSTLLFSDVCAWTFGGATFLTLTLISLDKYIALYFSLRYKDIVTTKRVVCTVLGFWMCCVIVAPVALVHFRSVKALIFVLPVFVFLIGVNVWCYYKIVRVVRQQHFQICHQASISYNAAQQAGQVEPQANSFNMARYVRSLRTVFYIAGVFILCYLPLAIFLVFLQFFPKLISSYTKPCFLIVSETAVYVNSSLNPPIYFWRVTRLRHTAMEKLRKLRQFNPREISRPTTQRENDAGFIWSRNVVSP